MQQITRGYCDLRKDSVQLSPVSTAQGGGGSFKNRKPAGEFVVANQGWLVNQGWQSEATDGPKGT